MDSQSTNSIQDFQRPPLQEAPKKKANKLLVPLIFTSLLAIVGIGFGVYKQFFEEQKSCENTDTKTQSNTDTEVSEKIDTAIVESILQSKYDVQKYAYKGIINTFYNSLDNFDNSTKTLIAIEDYIFSTAHCNFSQENDTNTCSISYNDFNTTYKKLFGENARQESYTFNDGLVQEITYDKNENSYRTNSVGGIGGINLQGLIYKVVEAEKNNKQISAIVVVELIDSISSSNIESYSGGNFLSEDGLGELYDAMKVYEFVFTDYDGDYCLTSINKL